MGGGNSQPSADSQRQRQAEEAALKQKKTQEEKLAKKIEVQKISNDLDRNIDSFENK